MSARRQTDFELSPSDKLKAIIASKKKQRTRSLKKVTKKKDSQDVTCQDVTSDINHEVKIRSFRQQEEFGAKKRIKP